MRNRMSRILACFVAVVVALGSVCYRPPKAEAAVVPSALAVASVVAVMCATGFEINQEGTATGAIADAFERQIRSQMKEFAETRDMYQEQFEEAIASRVELLADGTMRIRSEAANLINSFTEWFIDKLGLTSGDDSAYITPPLGFASYNGYIFPDITHLLTADRKYAVIMYDNDACLYKLLTCKGISRPYGYKEDGVNYLFMTTNGVTFYKLQDGAWVQTLDSEGYSEIKDGNTIIWSSITIYEDTRLNDTLIDASEIVVGEGSFLSASLGASYEAAPTVEEQYAMVIDTGLTMDDEQSIIDSILSGAVAGTLTPAYAIEQAPAGDLVVPDEDTTQLSILSWVKTIAQSVKALPQSIAKAVESIFVPDQALVEEISSTFTDKFGFVSTLHQLGTDLLSIDADSQPPVVWIHLEDAEGTIDYGGTVKALDMSWYARYKEDGDRIMSGFLWVGFLWLLFKRVPAIINGGEMVSEYSFDLDKGERRRRR